MDGTNVSNIVTYLGTNPWLAILSFILAVIGVFLAYIFYRKSRRIKLTCYTIISHNLINDFVNKIDSLQVIYAGTPIENLTVSKIAFWNAGNETISKNDIVNADPIAVCANNGHELLGATIIRCTEESNEFKLGNIYNKNKINIDFDYMDGKHGVAIQVFHTGKTDMDIEICGKIKGAGRTKLMRQEPIDKLEIIKVILIIFTPPVAFMIILNWLLVQLSIRVLMMYSPQKMQLMNDYLFIFPSILITSFIMSKILKAPKIFNKINIKINQIMGREPEGLEVIEENF